MKYRLRPDLALALGLSLISFTLYCAQTPADRYNDKNPVLLSNKWFAGLGVGLMSPFGTNTSNFAPSGLPGFPDERYSGDNAKNSAQYSVLAGYQWHRATEWLPTYSLAFQYTYTSSIKINGSIFTNNLSDSKNFTYQYDISQQLPMAKLKIDMYRWQQLMPYVSVGAGVTYNRTSNYSDAPIPAATLMHRRYSFTSATETQFAASVGAGLDYSFSNQGQISLGYELSRYGKARTGSGQGSLSGYFIDNTLNANAVVLQGLYFFDL